VTRLRRGEALALGPPNCDTYEIAGDPPPPEIVNELYVLSVPETCETTNPAVSTHGWSFFTVAGACALKRNPPTGVRCDTGPCGTYIGFGDETRGAKKACGCPMTHVYEFGSLARLRSSAFMQRVHTMRRNHSWRGAVVPVAGVVTYATCILAKERAAAQPALTQVRRATPDVFTLEVEVERPIFVRRGGQGNTALIVRITADKDVTAVVWKASKLPDPKYYPRDTNGYEGVDYDADGNLILWMGSEGAFRLISFSPAFDPAVVAEARHIIARAQTRLVQVYDYREDLNQPKVRLVPAGDLQKD